MPERRDIQSVLSDIRVDVGQIKVRQEEQGKTLTTLSGKLDLGVFREEYERRHKAIEEVVNAAVVEATAARDEMLRQQGATRVWRVVFTGALSILGIVMAILHH